MGYYISTPTTSFAIHTDDLPRFFDLVAHLMSPEMVKKHGNGGSYDGGTKTDYWYAWVNTEDVLDAVKSKDIERVFECWGYELTHIAENDGVNEYRLDIRGGNAKIGDEEKLFSAIAPVVVHGSLIDVEGEDGNKWRWLFENGKFYAQDVIRTEIHFGEPSEISF